MVHPLLGNIVGNDLFVNKFIRLLANVCFPTVRLFIYFFSFCFYVDARLHTYELFTVLLKHKYLNPQTWPMIICYRIKPNVSGFEVISKCMLHDTGPI